MLCVASQKHVFVVSHEGVSRSGVARDGTSLRSVPDYERVGRAANKGLQVEIANFFATVFWMTSGHVGPPLRGWWIDVAIRFEQGRFPIVTPESGRFRFIRA